MAVPSKTQYQNGLLYEQAAQFAAALETSQTAAIDQMLAAWTDSYWGVRKDLDAFLDKVAAAQSLGLPTSPAWAFQEQRLKNLLDTTKVQIARYAADASLVTEKAQWSAIQASLKHAEKLAATAVASDLPGIGVSLANVNPKNLEHLVGHLANGSVLRNHLELTMPAKAASKVQEALIHGLATGKSQDWMRRKATEALGLSHTRATTILRTESLRAYRAASRAAYLANSDVLGGWVWNAHLDSRTCVACAIMDGTKHPLDATLDGHPRCRCAMVPRTKSWKELGLGDDLPDTRPPIRSGKEWLESQTPAVQRAMMGPAKFDAWTKGQITLDDMVARTYSPAWGTMRTERSLIAIQEGRAGNWIDVSAPLPQPVQKVATPNPATVAEYAERYDLDFLNEWSKTPGNSPQALADVHAAINLKVAQQGRIGPKMPRPDQAKVDKAVDKLAQAVLTKGYPSKGYSQTQAIYKAQANGTPGTQVGVVKSLTWEQKITAQAILEKHGEALPALARQWQKKDALEKAHDEALAIHATKKAQAEAEAQAKALQAEVDEYVQAYQTKLAATIQDAGSHQSASLKFQLEALDLDDQLKAAQSFDSTKNIAKVEGAQQTLKATKEAYEQAHQSAVDTYSGTDWTTPKADGFALHIEDDGWGTITGAFGQVHLSPAQVIQGLTDADAGWTQVLIPDPSEVKAWQAIFTDPDTGLVKPNLYEKVKAGSTAKMTPQQIADWQEALDQSWAAGKWEPEPEYVAKIKATLDSGGTDVAALQDLAQASSKPLTKANIQEAIAQWQAEQIAKASIPVPKPAIDVAKIKWEKVSDPQVQKLIAGVEQGRTTVDDLYVKFQASKNAGPKANYAKAILHLEGKGDQVPNLKVPDLDALEDFTPGGYVDPQMANYWTTQAENGNWDALLPENVSNAAHPTVKASMQAAIKEAWQDLGLEPPSKVADAWDLPMTTPPPTAPFKPPVTSTPTPAPQGPAWPTKPPWEPSALKDTGKVVGTHGGRILEAPDGTKWLFKPPASPRDGFLATLDEAASRFQALSGLKAPDTYVVTIGGKRGSIQRMFPAKDAFTTKPNPAALAKVDLDAIQREHVLDWFLSNHDTHRAQFLRLEDGTMVGIDKGQAFKHFGKNERLHWDYDPNHNQGPLESVYSILWRDFATGKDVDLDPPGTGALWDQVKAIQAIPDDDVRRMFREYAEQAAAQGKLSTGNDVEAFLDALVKRKHDLEKDFRALYEKAAKARSQALPGWKPKAAQVKASGTKAKWVGKDKPDPPKPPAEPKAETEHLFDSWLADAKARYTAFSGKNLEQSNNWQRFRRIVEDLSEADAKHLHQGQYLTDEQFAQVMSLIEDAKAKRAELEGAYKRALADHDKAVQAYKKDLTDWKDANGIQDLVSGMDDASVRHDDNAAGVRWAKKHFSEDRYTAKQRQTLRSYTGSSYASWNNHLRATKGKPTQYVESIKAMDKAMDAQPIPEDVILHRGTSLDSLELNGRKMGYGDDLANLIGSVQVDHAYMSTSVGNQAAFSSNPVQLKIRAPQGTPGSYVQMFSQYEHERELILARGTHMYVHNAYQKNGIWFLEVEVVPDDFDPLNATPTPSARPWSS